MPEQVLFDDLGCMEDSALVNAEPTNSAEVARMIYIINALEAKADQLDKQKEEALAFYEKRMESLEKQILFIKGKLEGYLRISGQKSVSTHNGTVILTTKTHRVWPKDDVLLQWVKSLNPEDVRDCIEITEKPRKSVIAEKLIANGRIPEGYTEVVADGLSIRNPKGEESS